MSPYATDLDSGDPLPNRDEVAHYCSSTRFNHDEHTPAPSAFMRRVNKGVLECDVSVDRLQSFPGKNRQEAVDLIRPEVQKRINIGQEGRFVVVDVGGVRTVTLERGHELDIVYTPEHGGPTHSSIVGQPDDLAEEARLATAIVRLVTSDDIYPGKV